MIDKIKKLANQYNFDKQYKQLTEECVEEYPELIQAVNKYRRYREALNTRDEILVSSEDNNLLIHKIVEEIAYIEIMLEKMKYLLNINPAAVEEIKLNKVNEQLEEIEKEKDK